MAETRFVLTITTEDKLKENDILYLEVAIEKMIEYSNPAIIKSLMKAYKPSERGLELISEGFDVSVEGEV